MKIPLQSTTAHLTGLLLAATFGIATPADEPREKPRPDAEARDQVEQRDGESKERAAAEKRRMPEVRDNKQRGERGGREERTEKPSPPQLKERLNDLLAQAREAEVAGNRERLADLKPQIAEIQQLLKRISSASPDAELPPELRPEAEKLEILARQIRHVMVAAENLAAAEMHDLAHELRQKAEAMERELVAGKEQLMARAQRRKSPLSDNPGRELQALREENQQLQRKLRELSERLERGAK
jgi:hypothetical protein